MNAGPISRQKTTFPTTCAMLYGAEVLEIAT
jgi:hypothetical protein